MMEKNEVEKEFDRVADLYFEKFGKNYPFMITDGKTIQDCIDDMQHCIVTNTAAKSPKYVKGGVY